MNPIRTLIVEDEPLARDRLRAFLEEEPGVQVVGVCGHGCEVAGDIRRLQPDLVFLDIQLPGCDGLDALAELPVANRPAVIFATAHERYAIEAFAFAAVDYLLKPFDRSRFQLALRRAEEQLRRARDSDSSPLLPAPGSDRLAFKAEGRLVFLRREEIVWAEAVDNFVVLHLASGQLTLRETMIALEERLAASGFTRVNRSALVNAAQVREIVGGGDDDCAAILRDGTRLVLSRNLRAALERYLGSR